MSQPRDPNRRRTPVTSARNERVSDVERDGVVEQLRLNMAEGRLDVHEFGDRVEQALVARTGADLSAVLSDLPHLDSPTVAAERRRKLVRAILTPYLAVNGFLILVWAITGFGYFWPIWPILGWGLGVVISLANVAGSGGRPSRAP